MIFSRLPCCVMLIAITFGATALPAVQSRAQAPAEKKQNGKPSTEKELLVFPLKHARASEVVRILQEAIGGEIRATADPNTNSVLVNFGAGERAQVEKLIKTLDVITPDPIDRILDRTQVMLLPLDNLVADAELEKTMRSAFEGLPFTFAVDRQRRIMVLSGNRQICTEAAHLLKKLEDAQSKRQRVGDLRVRIVWLVSGLKSDDAAAVPADLAEVATELSKLGIDKPRLAAQLLINTPLDTPFQVEGSARLDTPCQLAVTGTLSEKAGAPSLEIELFADRGGAGPANPFSGQGTRGGGRVTRGAQQICGLKTNITTPLGHAVMVGVTPTEGMTSVFVVQVLRK